MLDLLTHCDHDFLLGAIAATLVDQANEDLDFVYALLRACTDRRKDGIDVRVALESLLDDRGRVEARPVVPGARRMEGWIEIDSGLRVGDLLVDPAVGVEAGDRVRVVGEAQVGEGA